MVRGKQNRDLLPDKGDQNVRKVRHRARVDFIVNDLVGNKKEENDKKIQEVLDKSKDDKK